MIETRAPGYILRIAPEQLDLHRFERLAERAAEAGDKGRQARLRSCCERRSGSGEATRSPISRTSRSRTRRSSGSKRFGWRQSERRIDAELAIGRHAELVGELQELVARPPSGSAFGRS